MTRLSTLVASVFASGVVLVAQQPSIQNGKVEARQATSIDREIASVGASADPVWIGWRVPIVDGEHGGCNSWFSDYEYGRGYLLDYSPLGATTGGGRPQIAPPSASAPVPIEAGTGLVVLARVSDGRVERMRALGDDCPIDAGGRTMYWLSGITPAESLRWLDSLTRMDVGDRLSMNARRSLATAAVSAIAYHRDAAADPILDRIATNDTDSNLRQQAQTSLGSTRGAHGFATLRALLARESRPDSRRQLVTALGQTHEAGTVDALRAYLKDADPQVRSSAVYYFAIRGGQAVVAEVRAIVDTDVDDKVRTRAVSGLARLPPDAAVPLLIELARTNKNLEVRKQAVTLLGQSQDPRARAFLQELLK
jgi:hypothetical protein